MQTEGAITIRPLRPGEYSLLAGWVYEAIFVPEGVAKPPRDIVREPALQAYWHGFGERPDDRALCAEASRRLVGAVWVRQMQGYGFVSDRVPELSMALAPDWRGRGIGTRLLRTMLSWLRSEEVRQVSLSVQRANRAAWRLYDRFGFRIVEEGDGECVMLCDLDSLPGGGSAGDTASLPIGAERIRREAAAVGFDLCGICRPVRFEAERRFFDGWLERGCDAGLGYLRRNVEKRFDVSALMPEARSVIVCAVAYRNDTSLGYGDAPDVPKVASYARCVDYHVSIKAMLAELAGRLVLQRDGIRFRTFADTAPLLEKRLAVAAGLGFIGRNKLLITPAFGSFVLLGELVIDRPVDRYDAPLSAGAGCGACRRCEEACPTGALTSGGLDARRCIARRTIERDLDTVPELAATAGLDTDGWIFGCDVCQSVCPYNRHVPPFRNERFRPLFHPADMAAEAWLALSEEAFENRFGATPMARAGLERIKRLLRRRDG